MAHINSGVIAISQTPNDDEVPEDARRQRLLLGRRRLRAAARAHPDARQERPQHPARRRAVVRARARARLHGQARDRLLAHDRGPAAPDNRVTVDRQGSIHLAKTYHNDGAAPAAAAQAQGAARRPRLPAEADPARGRCSTSASRSPASRTSAAPCASATDPGDVGARRQLQGARPRQPLRRRHELLPVVERGEPGADGDGERAARRRPPARAARRARRRRRAGGQRHDRQEARRWRHEDASTRSRARSARASSPASPAPPR